jgi:hypothetical protein
VSSPNHPILISCTLPISLPNAAVRRGGGARNGIVGARWKPYSVSYESATRIHLAGAYGVGVRQMAADYEFRGVALSARSAIPSGYRTFKYHS